MTSFVTPPSLIGVRGISGRGRKKVGNMKSAGARDWDWEGPGLERRERPVCSAETRNNTKKVARRTKRSPDLPPVSRWRWPKVSNGAFQLQGAVRFAKVRYGLRFPRQKWA